MNKLSKSCAGYIEQNNTDFTCGDCQFVKLAGAGLWGCCFMGHGEYISAEHGSCNLFTYGKRGDELPYLGSWTKTELGYMENEQGFGCKRCSHMSIAKRDCTEVDKNSAGDTPGEISVTTCCNLWEADPKRSKMNTPKLFQLIELTDKGAGRLSPDEYRKLHEMGG